jgi:hypothetical protein
MKFIKKIPKQILVCILVALSVSLFSSFITYKILERKIPKIAVVDLSYLNNGFMINLSRHLVENKMGDEAVEMAVKTHIQTLESILKDISHSKQNYILLQKQTVASVDVEDITPELEKVLFNAIVAKTKGGSHEEEK